MWIYSLGISLRLTISSKNIQFGAYYGDLSNSQQQQHLQYHHQRSKRDAGITRKVGGASDNVKNRDEKCDVNEMSSLDRIILAMCDPRLTQRASLMFLLDVSLNLFQFSKWLLSMFFFTFFLLCLSLASNYVAVWRYSVTMPLECIIFIFISKPTSLLNIIFDNFPCWSNKR